MEGTGSNLCTSVWKGSPRISFQVTQVRIKVVRDRPSYIRLGEYADYRLQAHEASRYDKRTNCNAKYDWSYHYKSDKEVRKHCSHTQRAKTEKNVQFRQSQKSRMRTGPYQTQTAGSCRRLMTNTTNARKRLGRYDGNPRLYEGRPS